MEEQHRQARACSQPLLSADQSSCRHLHVLVGYTSSIFFALWAPELGFNPQALAKYAPTMECGACEVGLGSCCRVLARLTHDGTSRCIILVKFDSLGVCGTQPWMAGGSECVHQLTICSSTSSCPAGLQR